MKKNTILKGILSFVIVISSLIIFSGCTEAERVRENLAQESDNFNVVRQVTVIDCITGDTLFQMSGRCSIVADTNDKQLEIVVEYQKGFYQKHIIGLSDNVTYLVEDLDVKDVSSYQYEINFNPKLWIPVKPDVID